MIEFLAILVDGSLLVNNPLVIEDYVSDSQSLSDTWLQKCVLRTKSESSLATLYNVALGLQNQVCPFCALSNTI